MKQPPVLFTPTLAEVQSRFTIWRKNKKHRSRIPEELWAAAVMLRHEYSIHKIAKALSLSFPDLKKRIQSDKTDYSSSTAPSTDFIPIDISPTDPAECLIEMEHHDGNKMRMHFKGKVALDLQSFAESFWSARV